MTLLIALFSVLAGLAFGSFLNVCISRLPLGESVVHPRSRCPSCRHPVRSFDNIPLLSWILLRGRCRDCRSPISIRYPLIELATAALFLLCALRYGLSIQLLGGAIFCWLMLGLAATDAEWLLLPDWLTLPGIVLGVVFAGLSSPGGVNARLLAAGRSVLTALIAAGVIFLIRWIYWLLRRREGMGLGDAKLLALIGAWLGPWLTGLTLFLGVVAAAIYGITALAVARTARGDQNSAAPPLPFGSFLCGAAILALFSGESLLEWYLRFFR